MVKYQDNRRRNYFIDKSFQSKFIVKFCLIIISATILTGVLAYYLNITTTTVAFENLKVVVKTTADFILPIMVSILIIVTVLAAIITIVMTLFVSHKLSGPLYRLTLEIDRIIGRDLSSKVNIRATDQLQQLASQFDTMRKALNGDIKDIKRDWGSLKTDLQKLIGEIKDKDQKDRVDKAILDIDSKVSKFRTD